MAKKTPESHSAPPSSSDNTDSSSSSSEGEPSTPAKKPPPVEPTTKTTTSTKPRSKPNHKPSNPTPIPPKRPPPPPTTTTTPLNKKPKTTTTTTAGEDETKKSSTTLFQRLWSEDDEIVILEGILEYKAKKGADPMADTNGFHDFIKSSLHLNFDRRQMISKLRRLKKRFENSLGKNRTPNSSHDRAVLALSDKIWGNDVITQSKKSSNSLVRRKIKEEGSASSSSWKFIGRASVAMGLDENVVKLGLECCDEDKKGEIEEKWKELHMEESNIFSRKLELARQENKLIVEALKSGGK